MVDQCGVTEAELSAKKEVFQQHSAGDTTIGFEEFRCAACEQIFLRTNIIFFRCLYRDISGLQEDEFLNTYVESIFR